MNETRNFAENPSIYIAKSHRLHEEGNARINQVLVLRLGLAIIIETVHTSRHVERPEPDLDMPANACCINYTETEL